MKPFQLFISCIRDLFVSVDNWITELKKLDFFLRFHALHSFSVFYRLTACMMTSVLTVNLFNSAESWYLQTILCKKEVISPSRMALSHRPFPQLFSNPFQLIHISPAGQSSWTRCGIRPVTASEQIKRMSICESLGDWTELYERIPSNAEHWHDSCGVVIQWGQGRTILTRKGGGGKQLPSMASHVPCS